MKFNLITFGLCLIACVFIAIALQVNVRASEDAPSLRSRIALPKIFNFELFKQLYKKSYGSLIENLARRRIYLAKSFRAFISMVFYKNRQSSSYLAINDMSDWTPEEVDKTFMDLDALRGSKLPHIDEEVQVADLEDIKEELEDIVELESDSSLREIAGELAKRENPKAQDEDTNTDVVIPSNNPNYHKPEIVDFPLDRNHVILSEGELATIIATEPGSISKLIKKSFAKNKKSDEANFSQFKPRGNQKKPRDDDQFYPILLEYPNEKPKQTEQNIAKEEPEEDHISVDHRSKCFFHPRKQNGCGSCYAFAAISIYEWFHCMTTGKKVSFSEQYIVDCGIRTGLGGCNGGITQNVPEFVAKYGIELSKNYPYTGKEGTCPYSETEPEESMGYLRIESNGFKWVHPDHIEQQLKKTPLLIILHANENFLEYGGGIDEPQTCRKTFHAMVLVGSGREDGQDYWLIRNSHGVVWGERGFYKLTKKSTCSDTHYFYRLDSYKVVKAKAKM